MHIIGILIAVASLVYWLGMASRGAREVSNLVGDVKNMPRRRKFQKSASKTAIDTIEAPIDAATMLLVAMAKASGQGVISATQTKMMCSELRANMQLDVNHADDLVTQMTAISHQVVQADTLLYPMVDVLRGQISMDDARDLANMMERVAMCESEMTPDQSSILRRYKERMGLAA